MGLEIHPVTPDRGEDLVRLFGPNGAYANCWCTWWIFTSRQFDEAEPAERRRRLESMIAAGDEPGLLAYDDDEPVGWVAVGPRSRYARMMSARSRVFRPLDDEPSWVINCFYVTRDRRERGVANSLLEAAIEYAFERGATRIEAYPLDPSVQSTTSATLFVGSLPMFLDAGFEAVARVGLRPVVRLAR